MIELRHLDIRHFVTTECSHLANGRTTKCGCISLILFGYLSCLGTIICYINTIGFCFGMHAEYVKLWLQVVKPFTRRP